MLYTEKKKSSKPNETIKSKSISLSLPLARREFWLFSFFPPPQSRPPFHNTSHTTTPSVTSVRAHRTRGGVCVCLSCVCERFCPNPPSSFHSLSLSFMPPRSLMLSTDATVGGEVQQSQGPGAHHRRQRRPHQVHAAESSVHSQAFIIIFFVLFARVAQG